MYDNFYIVGAPHHDYDDTGGGHHNNAGAAYIYDANNSWAEDKVVHSDRNDQDNLGEDVDIYEFRAVVGAPLQDYDINGDPPYWGNGGAAFAYEKDESGIWNQTQKLLTNDRFSADKFGHSVAIFDDTIIGGAPEDNGTVPSTGALYIFKDETLAVNDSNFITYASLYPNPTSNLLNINLDKSYHKIDIQVSNFLGQIVLTKRISNTKEFSIQLGNFKSGIYLVELETEEGNRVILKAIKK